MKKTITFSAATLALLVAGASGASAVSAASAVSTKDSTGTIGFAPGELAIDYASDLAFGGTNTISSKSATYYANAPTAFKDKAVGAFVEMHDLRGLGSGGNNGTQLTVTQLKQFNNVSGAELKGATLSFSSGKAANAGGGTYTPTATESFTLKPGEAQLVMSTDGTVGSFLTSYGKAADYKENKTEGPISLSVPSGAALAGTFTATLQWNLVTAP